MESGENSRLSTAALAECALSHCASAESDGAKSDAPASTYLTKTHREKGMNFMKRNRKPLLTITALAACALTNCGFAMAGGAEKEVPIGTYVTNQGACEEGFKGKYDAFLSRDDGLVFMGGHCELKKNNRGKYLRCENAGDGPDYNVKFNISADKKTLTLDGTPYYSCGRTVEGVI